MHMEKLCIYLCIKVYQLFLRLTTDSTNLLNIQTSQNWNKRQIAYLRYSDLKKSLTEDASSADRLIDLMKKR